MKQLTVKFDTFPWKLNQEQFNFYTDGNDGVVGRYRFIVNNDSVTECDFWIVRGGLDKLVKSARCPSKNVIFLQDEVYDEREFKKAFLDQFSVVIGPKFISHKNYVFNCEMFPWLFVNKTLKSLSNVHPPKNKEICLMTSDALWLEGHKRRFAFSNQLIGHFKDRLDVFGRGFKEFDCKYEILKDYKYCICLENNPIKDYFTEKINECYLAEVFPIYHGCPNIYEYYSPNAMLLVDLDNFTESIAKIEELLAEDPYEKRIDLLREMKNKYLNQYHLPVRLTQLLDGFGVSTERKRNYLFSEKCFHSFSEAMRHLKTGMGIFTTRAISTLFK